MSNVWGNLLNKGKPVELMFSSKETSLLKKIMNKLLIKIRYSPAERSVLRKTMPEVLKTAESK